MEDLKTYELSYDHIKTLDDLTGALNSELNKAAISFVRIGYLLKTARDTDILKDSQYANMNEYAQERFGLDKSQVSRFININDRFSIGGYSEHLKVEYEGYGQAKLALMLTLPDELNEELSPEYSKADIQAIKEEYEEEQKITPIELMTEPAPDQPETGGDEFLALIVKQLNDEHPTPITLIHQIRQEGYVTSDDVTDAYRPDGDKVYIIRVSGQGRFTVTMKADKISIVNARTFEKSVVTWEEWMDLVLEDEEDREFKPEEIEKAKETTKKKVEKSAASVQKTSKSVQKSPDSVQNPEETDKKVENTDDVEIEKVEGEVIDNPETQQNTLADDDQPLPKNTAQSTEQYITSEDAGQRIDNVPQNIPYPDSEKPEITHVSSEDPLPKENDKAAGYSSEISGSSIKAAGDSSEAADNSIKAAGDKEDNLIKHLDELMFNNPYTRASEAANEIRYRSHRNYREFCDEISGWIADIRNTTNNLYAILASRGQ